MNSIPDDLDRYLRKVLVQVARRVGITAPEDQYPIAQLPDRIGAMVKPGAGTLVREVLEEYVQAYRHWYDKVLELKQAAANNEDLTTIRPDLMDLMKKRDESEQALIRYLDHYYPRSVTPVAV